MFDQPDQNTQDMQNPGDARLDDGALDRAGNDVNRGGPAVQAGAPVFDAEGERVGTVAPEGMSGGMLVVESGFIFHHKTDVPFDVVQAADAQGVYLSVTKDQVKDKEWGAHATDSTGSPTAAQMTTEQVREIPHEGLSGDALRDAEAAQGDMLPEDAANPYASDPTSMADAGSAAPMADDALPLAGMPTHPDDNRLVNPDGVQEADPPPTPLSDDDIIRQEQRRLQ